MTRMFRISDDLIHRAYFNAQLYYYNRREYWTHIKKELKSRLEDPEYTDINTLDWYRKAASDYCADMLYALRTADELLALRHQKQ